MESAWKNSERIERMIQETLLDCPAQMREIAEHLLQTNGKGIRGQLLILASRIGEVKDPPESVFKLAAALEILHLATLIHDDIVDDAPARRGRESVQLRFGKGNAVIYGDYLFARSFTLLSDQHTGHLNQLAKGVRKICEGEIRQQHHRYRFDISIYSYLKAIAGKTAMLFAGAMAAGAREGGLDEIRQTVAARAGFNIGMCFQIVDDCLDFCGNESNTGKPRWKDMTEGYGTLPLLFALRNDDTGELKRKMTLVYQGKTSPSKAAGLVIHLRGVEKSKEIAERYMEKAVLQLGKLGENPQLEEIKSLVRDLYGRIR